MSDIILSSNILKLLPNDLRVEIITNTCRKDWTESEKAKLQNILRSYLEKSKTPGKRNDLKKRNSATSAKDLAQVKKTDSRINTQIGNVLGDSHETVRKRDEVFKEIGKNPKKYGKLKKNLESGKTSVSTAYMQVTKPKRNLQKAAMPRGVYDVFIADVPIMFDDHGGRGAADNHYNTMTAQNIAKMSIPSADNAICFFWMSPSIAHDTVPIRHASQDKDDGCNVTVSTPIYKAILDAWGFTKIKGDFAWNKEIMGVGHWTRNQHETCFVAIKGKMPPPLEVFPSVISERRTAHSKKPESLYSMVERMYPKGRYIEIFARKRHSEKWAVFGNQIK